MMQIYEKYMEFSLLLPVPSIWKLAQIVRQPDPQVVGHLGINFLSQRKRILTMTFTPSLLYKMIKKMFAFILTFYFLVFFFFYIFFKINQINVWL